MSLAYGRELAGLLMMLGTTMHDVGRSAGFSATFTIEGANAWWSHPYAYDQVVQAVVRLLEAARPVGERRPPKGPDAEARALRIKCGTDFANSMIDVVCGRVATERDGTEGDKLRRLLRPGYCEAANPVSVKRLKGSRFCMLVRQDLKRKRSSSLRAASSPAWGGRCWERYRHMCLARR